MVRLKSTSKEALEAFSIFFSFLSFYKKSIVKTLNAISPPFFQNLANYYGETWLCNNYEPHSLKNNEHKYGNLLRAETFNYP